MECPPTSNYRRNPRISERELPGELILYDPQTDRAFLLNKVSAAIWGRCDGRHSTEQVAAEIAESFEGGKTVFKDVKQMIEELLREGLLVN